MEGSSRPELFVEVGLPDPLTFFREAGVLVLFPTRLPMKCSIKNGYPPGPERVRTCRTTAKQNVRLSAGVLNGPGG